MSIGNLAYTPNDPTMPLGIADYLIDQAWDVTKGRPDVKIGVSDSGVSTTHPDIAPNLVGCDSVISTPAIPAFHKARQFRLGRAFCARKKPRNPR